jgi:D-alanyl-D-alanine carboxypeptidase
MRHHLFQIRLILLWLCLTCVSISAQTKPVVKVKNQTAKVDAFVRQKMTANHIPGLSLAIVRDGKIILAKGYGMANLELSVSANEKTSFAIYSITKTFTGVATMMLVEEGKISLEDPISKYIKDLPVVWQPITVRQLLNHTSGIKDFAPILFESGDMTRDYTPAEVLKLVAAFPLEFPSGERWDYTNTGFYLLGMLIEKVSGKTYEQFLTERIFAPLEMRDTRLENLAEIIPNRANGYTWQNNNFRNATRISPTLSFSVAGIVSTVLDLAKYDAALYTEKLLKKKTLQQMWTATKLNNGQIVEQGLGFGLTPYQGHKRVGHSGGAAGFSTTITRLIDDKVTVIILTNADQEGFLISDIANEIASFYFAK